jgi:glutathione S-transferase
MTSDTSTSQYPKLTLYYLAQSRSHRILWLLNEISVPCTLIYSPRGPNGVCTNPAFAKAHPLGTAPILEIQYPYLDHPIILSESALIIDFLCENVPHGRKLLPAKYQAGQERAGMETLAWKQNKFYFAWGEESLLSFIAVAFVRDCSSSFLEEFSFCRTFSC